MSNKSYALDNRAAASDDAQLGQGTAVQSKDESFSQGGFLTTNIGPGAIKADGGSNVYVTDGGAYDLARDLTSKYTTTLTEYMSAQRAAETDATAKQSSLLGDLVKSFGSLVESKNTGGDSSRNSIILWLGLGLLAVLGLFLLRPKRA